MKKQRWFFRLAMGFLLGGVVVLGGRTPLSHQGQGQVYAAPGEKSATTKPHSSAFLKRWRPVKGLPGAKEVYIPPGSFIMGSTEKEQTFVYRSCRRSRVNSKKTCEKWCELEGPQTHVKLTRGFWMFQTEVTQGQFKALLGYNRSLEKERGLKCPVEWVSWYEALAFANKLSARAGREKCFECKGQGKKVICRIQKKFRGKRYYLCEGYRLPTEAEWEYAARAGTTTMRYTGRCLPASHANYHGDFPMSGCPKVKYREGIIPVGSLRPNPWGLYDILGNVGEYCWDRHAKYPGGNVVDPTGPLSGSTRVVRGGSWGSVGGRIRSAARRRISPFGRSNTFGFRLVRRALFP